MTYLLIDTQRSAVIRALYNAGQCVHVWYGDMPANNHTIRVYGDTTPAMQAIADTWQEHMTGPKWTHHILVQLPFDAVAD